MINQSKPRILWSILLYDGVIGAITIKACRSKMFSVFEYHSILHLWKRTLAQSQKHQIKQCPHVQTKVQGMYLVILTHIISHIQTEQCRANILGLSKTLPVSLFLFQECRMLLSSTYLQKYSPAALKQRLSSPHVGTGREGATHFWRMSKDSLSLCSLDGMLC